MLNFVIGKSSPHCCSAKFKSFCLMFLHSPAAVFVDPNRHTQFFHWPHLLTWNWKPPHLRQEFHWHSGWMQHPLMRYFKNVFQPTQDCTPTHCKSRQHGSTTHLLCCSCCPQTFYVTQHASQY